MILINVTSIIANMLIHLKVNLGNIENTIMANIGLHVFLWLQTNEIYGLFQSLQQACQLVWDYYDKKAVTPSY